MANKKKWKKRIKKALKGAALAGGALLAAKAMSKPTIARGTRAPDFVKGIPAYKHKDDIMKFPNAGVAVGVDYQASPFERSKVAPYLKGIDRSPVDRRDTSNFYPEIETYMSKGGRVRGAGKAKRGLGRAFTKRKK